MDVQFGPAARGNGAVRNGLSRVGQGPCPLPKRIVEPTLRSVTRRIGDQRYA
jgi:hypothetical protein